MANEVVMPRLGWTMEAGTLVEWLKSDGDEVEAGELLFAVETDKAVQEVEAIDSGILSIPIDTPIGIEKPVGTTLGFIVAPGETAPASVAGGSVAAAEPVKAIAETDAPSATTSNGHREEPAISPRARRIAGELGIDWRVLVGTGSTGRIREVDVRAAVASRPAAPERRASPVVRRLAEETGVSLDQAIASKPAGRVTRSDVLAASVPPAPSIDGTPMPISKVRRLIADRMTESARTVAPVTLTTEADATELVAIRGHLKAEIGENEVVPSYTDLIVRLTALALLKHPDLNASWTDAGIVRHQAVNISVAVDSERGLLAPVIRDADRKSSFQIAQESAQLIKQARAGSINADHLQGGGFTISNLGMFEIDAFTPLINLPDCAVLGLGRIVAKPVVIDGEAETIAVRKMIALSLTFDHRIVDGAPAARFLQQIKRMIERPYAWLTR
jgi:pyruvate dehydrogenase E2 component (dihydrolipoamide acetyltransferase)